jgi:hypothetical protein
MASLRLIPPNVTDSPSDYLRSIEFPALEKLAESLWPAQFGVH